MKKNLYVLIPNATDGTSLYRGWGPLSKLKEVMPEVSFIVSERVDWSILINCDAAFLQRPFTDAHLKVCQMIKNMNIPLWVDYDDDLFCVPRSNPTFENYSTDETRLRVATILGLADHVSVSTKQLATAYNRIREKNNKSNCEIIPNALDLKLFPETEERTKQRHRLAVWRGSATHDEDLMEYEQELVQAAKKFPDVLFQFIGKPFWGTVQNMKQNAKNVQSAKGVDPIEYFTVMRKIQPLAMFVPLKETPFNLSKSNIAWLEGTYAGAVSLVPDWEEWQRPGAIRYKDKKDFYEKFSNILRGEIDTQAHTRESWEWIKENLLLSKINLGRRDILQKMFDS